MENDKKDLRNGGNVREIEKILINQGATTNQINMLWRIYDEIKNEKCLYIK